MGVTAWVRRDVSRPKVAATVAPEAGDEASGTPGVPETPQDGMGGGSATSDAPHQGDISPRASEGGTDEYSVDPGVGAIAAMEWRELEAAVRNCTRCPLHQSRSQGVVGVGNRRANLVIVGEAPGGEEDRRGEPFVGRAGGLLDMMLNAIGLDRGGVYITNILKSRPPDNRDPRAEEVAACEPYLKRQIELIEPGAILAVGRIAAQNLLASSQPLGKLRGRWHEYGPRSTLVRVSYHPAYLLRCPADKAKAWHDLKQVRDTLDR